MRFYQVLDRLLTELSTETVSKSGGALKDLRLFYKKLHRTRNLRSPRLTFYFSALTSRRKERATLRISFFCRRSNSLTAMLRSARSQRAAGKKRKSFGARLYALKINPKPQLTTVFTTHVHVYVKSF
jgi:hypothetical protein